MLLVCAQERQHARDTNDRIEFKFLLSTESAAQGHSAFFELLSQESHVQLHEKKNLPKILQVEFARFQLDSQIRAGSPQQFELKPNIAS